MAGDDNEVYDKKLQRYAEDNRLNRVASEAELTNDWRLRSTYCSWSYTTDRHEASRGLSATAGLLVLNCVEKDRCIVNAVNKKQQVLRPQLSQHQNNQPFSIFMWPPAYRPTEHWSLSEILRRMSSCRNPPNEPGQF